MLRKLKLAYVNYEPCIDDDLVVLVKDFIHLFAFRTYNVDCWYLIDLYSCRLLFIFPYEHTTANSRTYLVVL